MIGGEDWDIYGPGMGDKCQLSIACGQCGVLSCWVNAVAVEYGVPMFKAPDGWETCGGEHLCPACK